MTAIGVSTSGETIVRAIEELDWVDEAVSPVQEPINRLVSRPTWLRTFLTGAWLGHPVHSAITDVPIGGWVTGTALDALDALNVTTGHADGLRRAADTAHAIGVAGALAAAVFGLADWSYTSGRPRRIGAIHGIGNVVATGLFAASLVARRRGSRDLGMVLSTAGLGLVTFTAWLGGELVYRHGVGVSRTAFQDAAQKWTAVLADEDLRESPRRVDVDGVPVLLVRSGRRIFAMGDTCTHMGCSLSEGEFRAGAVTCRCHGSTFRLDDGQVVTGPATVPAPRYEAHMRAGQIQVRRAD